MTFVAHNSPAAVQALLAPDARPALLPLLVAAVWDKRYSAQTLRLHAMRALARLTQVAQPAALAPLVSLRWLDAAVPALLAGADQDPEPAQELFMALARTPVLRPVVAQAPAALHMLASHVAAHYRVPATQSAASDRPATKAIAVLISHGDAALAALASAALRAAGAGGAAALADITVRDARVSTALAAAECAPEAAAAALEASTRRAKHFLRTHADDGQAELARMAEPDGGAAEDEVKQIALRRAALVLRASVQASWEHWIEYNREHVAQQAHVTAAHGGLFMDHKMNTLCGPVLGTLASTRSTGLFATLRAPEVYLHVADGSEAQARDGLSTACCIHVAGILDNLALEAVMQFMEAQPGADARRVALLRDGFTIRRFQAQAVLYRVCGGDEAPPDTKAIVRDADAQAGICFRFEAPAPGGEVAAAVHGTYSSSTFSARSFQSIAALTYFKDSATPDYDLEEHGAPVLFCDVRACLARIKAAADRGFPAPTRLLERLRTRYPTDGSDGQAAADDDCFACVHCRARRFNGTMCARPGCSLKQTPEGGSLRRCKRCRLRAYCGPLCQQMDWRRHKKEDCAPKAGAAPASAGEASSAQQAA